MGMILPAISDRCKYRPPVPEFCMPFVYCKEFGFGHAVRRKWRGKTEFWHVRWIGEMPPVWVDKKKLTKIAY